MSEQNKVMATLEEYSAAYCAKDTDRLMRIFADDDSISLIGTGADELCAGPAAIREVFDRNFAEATANQFEWHWKQITIVGDSAVVAITLSIHLIFDGQAITVPIRWTVSLSRIDGVWKWLHRHASAAATSQDEGTAYPTDK
ncbi:nuclear transport factor 2 family protein [Kiloniella sp.]|uniref:nuclear transport factor 2 family protein n=1 Tax=Kiloniella sp. TaxID=1938587 RepID=UPI003B020222